MTPPTFCVQTAEGVVLDIRVIPRAKKTQAGGLREGALLVRLAAPPVDGAANEALLAFLARQLGVARKNIRLVGGEHGRRKRVVVAGVSADAVRTLLNVQV